MVQQGGTMNRDWFMPLQELVTKVLFGQNLTTGQVLISGGGNRIISGGSGPGITQLTGMVEAGPGSGSQVAKLKAVSADPASPAHLDIWVSAIAGTPTTIALKIRYSGVTYVIAAIEI